MRDDRTRKETQSATPRGEIDVLARLVRLAGPRPPVPPDRAARVEAAVRDSWRQTVRAGRRRRALGWASGLAAAAALVLAAGAALWSPAPAEQPVVARLERVSGSVLGATERGAGEPLGVGQRVAAGTVVDTGAASRAAFRLVGGPSLRLDAGTRLRFTGIGELALESGAVYVDAVDDLRPVVVQTPLGEVRDVGTQFEVRLRADRLVVRVREGEVRLTAGGAGFSAEAGEGLQLAPDGTLARHAVSPHGPAWAWVEQIAPPFELEGKTLAEFLLWASRETGRRVRFAEGRLTDFAPEVVLHGSVAELAPEQALLAVLPTCGLAHRIDGGDLLIFATELGRQGGRS
ncbi:MAG TPA: FecR family protein [Thermoanaerobaculia bacterium]|nr:FecR family protein [Thermoanaerobaculia bacterium]